MSCLRRKIWVALFFALITIGQGFALSYVMNLPKIQEIQSAASQSPIPPYLLVCGHDFEDILQANPQAHHKPHHELLSLRSDPFLLSIFRASPLHFTREAIWLPFFPSAERFDLVFEKPPKNFSLI